MVASHACSNASMLESDHFTGHELLLSVRGEGRRVTESEAGTVNSGGPGGNFWFRMRRLPGVDLQILWEMAGVYFVQQSAVR